MEKQDKTIIKPWVWSPCLRVFLHSLHIKPAPVYAVINVFGLNNTPPVCLPHQLMSAFTFIISTFKRRLYKSCSWGGSEEKALRLGVHKEERPKIQEVEFAYFKYVN